MDFHERLKNAVEIIVFSPVILLSVMWISGNVYISVFVMALAMLLFLEKGKERFSKAVLHWLCAIMFLVALLFGTGSEEGLCVLASDAISAVFYVIIYFLNRADKEKGIYRQKKTAIRVIAFFLVVYTAIMAAAPSHISSVYTEQDALYYQALYKKVGTIPVTVSVEEKTISDAGVEWDIRHEFNGYSFKNGDVRDFYSASKIMVFISQNGVSSAEKTEVNIPISSVASGSPKTITISTYPDGEKWSYVPGQTYSPSSVKKAEWKFTYTIKPIKRAPLFPVIVYAFTGIVIN